MKLGVISIVLAVSLAAGQAAAGDGIVGKFFGAYEGSGTWGTGMPPREMSVVIRPSEKGFNVSWNSKKLSRGKIDKSKSHSIDFLKTAKDSVFVSKDHKGRTDIPMARDPLAGPMPQEPLIWARVDENRLSLYAFRRTADGEADVQAYHRTLNGDKMKLHFIRYLDGRPVKQTKGKLKRQAE